MEELESRIRAALRADCDHGINNARDTACLGVSLCLTPASASVGDQCLLQCLLYSDRQLPTIFPPFMLDRLGRGRTVPALDLQAAGRQRVQCKVISSCVQRIQRNRC